MRKLMVAVALSIALVPLVAPSTASASSRAVSWKLVSELTCSADVWIISARGSGQVPRSYGPQIRAYLADVKKQLAATKSVTRRAEKLSVQVLDLDYPAVGVNLTTFITRGPGPTYLKSVARGEAKVLSTLRNARKHCIGQPSVVLTGYSQGAHVMRLAARDMIARRMPLLGAALIADPSNSFKKRANTLSYSGGSRWTSPRGSWAGVANPDQAAILPSALRDSVASICHKSDAVCRRSKPTARAIDAHRNAYRSKTMYRYPARWLAKKIAAVHGVRTS